MQLDIFEDNSDQGLLLQEFKQVKASSEKVRRCLFARLNQQLKLIIKQQAEIEMIKQQLGNKKEEYVGLFRLVG